MRNLRHLDYRPSMRLPVAYVGIEWVRITAYSLGTALAWIGLAPFIKPAAILHSVIIVAALLRLLRRRYAPGPAWLIDLTVALTIPTVTGHPPLHVLAIWAVAASSALVLFGRPGVRLVASSLLIGAPLSWLAMVVLQPEEVVISNLFIAFAAMVATISLVMTMMLRNRDLALNLDTSRRRFKSAFESAPIAMAIHAPTLEIVSANPAFAELFGIESAFPASGGTATEADEDLIHQLFDEVTSGGAPTAQATVQLSHEDGSLRWAIVTLASVRDHHDRLLNVITQALDVTDQYRAQQRLQEIIRSKDEFVAAVSHELRTPLTAVMGFSSELYDNMDALSNEEAADLVDVIYTESREVAGIVDDLLVAARAETGGITILPTVIDLEAEVATVLDALASKLGHTILVKGVAKAFADPLRVRQIVRNLLTNCDRYGGPVMQVHIVEHDRYASIIVRDNGSGVPVSDRERIFEPYARTASPEGQPAAVGLGLAVSSDLADLMGGTLTYDYVADWSEFTLTVPRPADAA